MKVTDYIVEFLITKGITDVFGYPGGMVTHLMDSFSKYNDRISAHVNYHEQAAAFAACAYAQTKNIPGVAYATSGPGAINLLTGVANAYFDSIPTIFITGQVNTYESKSGLGVRQKGFQETDIVGLADSITKYAVYVDDARNIVYELEKAFAISMDGRKGPVLLDIPMNVQRMEIDIQNCPHYEHKAGRESVFDPALIIEYINRSVKPVILAGRGISIAGAESEFREFVKRMGIPLVTSMIAVDCVESDSPYNFGFIGAYGHRTANFIIQNSDLIISFGSRMDCRQIGNDIHSFADNAQIIRVEIDQGELTNKVKQNEIDIVVDVKTVLCGLNYKQMEIEDFSAWMATCHKIAAKFKGMDDMEPNRLMERLGTHIPDNSVVTTDVGQNQVWVAQSLKIKRNTKVLFSGGLGSMGYSLPAAIGAYYAAEKEGKRIFSINGDGGFQMNLQELQFVKREKLPLKIIVFNNKSLGMIRHFQEMYFDSNYVQTNTQGGYSPVNLCKIADAYGIRYGIASNVQEIDGYEDQLKDKEPILLEINISDTTYVFPKLAIGHPIHDQDKMMDRHLFNELMELCKNV